MMLRTCKIIIYNNHIRTLDNHHNQHYKNIFEFGNNVLFIFDAIALNTSFDPSAPNFL